jgi:hypothetical protein
VKGTLVRISVPFTGEAQLFRYPSSSLGNRIPAEVVNNTIILAHAAEHPNEAEIRRDFDSRLSQIETALQFVRGRPMNGIGAYRKLSAASWKSERRN